MKLRFRAPIRLRRSSNPRREPLPVVRGNMHRVLVLRPPGDMFQEAVFVLKDDYFKTPGVSQQELLRQARTAAEDYTAAYTDDGGSFFPSVLSVFALGAASAVIALWLAGLL